MHQQFDGKRALVTGGTRGIGHAIAESLKSHGADVFISGRQLREASDRLFSVDFSDHIQLSAFVEMVRDLKIDILINNAGISVAGEMTEVSSADYQRIQTVNVEAAFALCQSVIPWMKSKAWGRIVNISSILGIVGRDNRAPYCISKFALNGLTTALSAEHAAKGILSNSVCPGFIDTELTARMLSVEEKACLIERVPARRLGTPKEVAELVVWLASPTNTFVCGQCIAIDGGFTGV